MSTWNHKDCGGEIHAHPNNDISFCGECGKWIDDIAELFIKWDIMNCGGSEAAVVNG